MTINCGMKSEFATFLFRSETLTSDFIHYFCFHSLLVCSKKVLCSYLAHRLPANKFCLRVLLRVLYFFQWRDSNKQKTVNRVCEKRNGILGRLSKLFVSLFPPIVIQCNSLRIAVFIHHTAINAVKLIDEKRLYFDKGLKACLNEWTLFEETERQRWRVENYSIIIQKMNVNCAFVWISLFLFDSKCYCFGSA